MAENLKKNPFVRERIERIEELFEIIKNNQDSPLSKIVGEFGYRYGLRDKTVFSYLNQLQQAGRIKFDRFEDTVEVIT